VSKENPEGLWNGENELTVREVEQEVVCEIVGEQEGQR
jgi:hypothetical protein